MDLQQNKFSEEYFDLIFDRFNAVLTGIGKKLPAVSYVAITSNDPYCVLISTLLSLRTKDDVTLKASERLLKRASTAHDMLGLSEKEIEELIFPVGFYHTKAQRILEISHILVEKYNGIVPDNVENLIALPGVGIKTANLTLNLGYGIDAICVDCHVHQISNRMGWVTTKTPPETEKALQSVMPRRFWIPLNELLVSYGQEICTSVSPKCSMCPMCAECPKIGVDKSR
ncbi:MAG: endonuclease III [Sphaerochaetaceae bacterium]|nr:endonuclease III [Sphaerochaetaceae bacterium]